MALVFEKTTFRGSLVMLSASLLLLLGILQIYVYTHIYIHTYAYIWHGQANVLRQKNSLPQSQEVRWSLGRSAPCPSRRIQQCANGDYLCAHPPTMDWDGEAL